MIDADPLVYRVGFSLEQVVHHINWVDVDPDNPEDPNMDTPFTAFFFSAARRDQFIDLRNLHEDEVEKIVERIPVSEERVVYGRVKQSLYDIEKNVADYLATHNQEIEEFCLFLTGGNNFRDEIATIKPYKGNRDRSLRPYWYEEIRSYLVHRWGAEVVNGMEADDACSILQDTSADRSTIICTIDKDLETVGGHFYNYYHKEAKYITEQEALVAFYRQLITGDAADNIPGCYRVGSGKANTYITPGMTEAEMCTMAYLVYSDNIAKYPEHHAPHTNARDSLVENARLLWMLREVGEVWHPPY